MIAQVKGHGAQTPTRVLRLMMSSTLLCPSVLPMNGYEAPSLASGFFTYNSDLNVSMNSRKQNKTTGHQSDEWKQRRVFGRRRKL
ncbi:hypothetical protein INR49_008873 [Caranx melampygus]|nr:hypothetical protein INR49_008873 [Caranx melampygus]